MLPKAKTPLKGGLVFLQRPSERAVRRKIFKLQVRLTDGLVQAEGGTALLKELERPLEPQPLAPPEAPPGVCGEDTIGVWAEDGALLSIPIRKRAGEPTPEAWKV